MAINYNNIGRIYKDQDIYGKAAEYYLKALKINEEIGNKKGISDSYSGIGGVYSSNGNYDKALENYFNSLKITENSSDKIGMLNCYIFIGDNYRIQCLYDKSLEYFSMALKISEEIGSQRGLSSSYYGIGIIYYYKELYDNALENFLNAMKIYQELGNKKSLSSCFNSIGNVYNIQCHYDKALKYFFKALNCFKELGDRDGLSVCYTNISNLYITLADSSALDEKQRLDYLNEAVKYGLKNIELAKEIKAIPRVNEAANTLMDAYEAMGNIKLAFKYSKIYIATKDSIFSTEKNKALAEMGAKYEAEKKQIEIEKMQKQKELDNKTIEVQTSENRKQQIIIFSAIGGFFIVLGFSIIILHMFRKKRKANILLAMQNAEIRLQKEEISAQRDEITAQRDTVVKQKDHIEEQKKEITDSITYAKRIQQAILPSGDYANNILGEHFILFKPKDIVSGDFYWGTRLNQWLIITVADCTGHGVPGAFMSMLGVSFLNEIVRKKEVTKASEVLDHLRKSVIEALQQKGQSGEQKDGMDMSIAAINTETKQCFWAGANNPLWLIRNTNIEKQYEDIAEKVEEIKPDKMPVAIHVKMCDFTNHEIQLETGDRLYLFSDGLPDQFGGEKGKKFLYKHFKKLLAETTSFSMKEQGELIEKEFENWLDWQGNKYEQIDDVTVLGIKI